MRPSELAHTFNEANEKKIVGNKKQRSEKKNVLRENM